MTAGLIIRRSDGSTALDLGETFLRHVWSDTFPHGYDDEVYIPEFDYDRGGILLSMQYRRARRRSPNPSYMIANNAAWTNSPDIDRLVPQLFALPTITWKSATSILKIEPSNVPDSYTTSGNLNVDSAFKITLVHFK